MAICTCAKHDRIKASDTNCNSSQLICFSSYRSRYLNKRHGFFLGILISLWWWYNGRDGIPNDQPHGCILNCFSRHRSKKRSKLCITGLCPGNPLVTGEFPAQRASNTENASIGWRHHVTAASWNILDVNIDSAVFFAKNNIRFSLLSQMFAPEYLRTYMSFWLIMLGCLWYIVTDINFNEIRAYSINFIHCFKWVVITCQCLDFKFYSHLTKPPRKLGHQYPTNFISMQLLIWYSVRPWLLA